MDGQKRSVRLLRKQRNLSECQLSMDNDVIKHPTNSPNYPTAYAATRRTRFRKTRMFTPRSTHRHRSMHASRNQRQETVQPTTVSGHSHPDKNQKVAAFTCFSLTPPNVVSPSVGGLDESPHIEPSSRAQATAAQGNELPHPCARQQLWIPYESPLPPILTRRRLVSSPTLDQLSLADKPQISKH